MRRFFRSRIRAVFDTELKHHGPRRKKEAMSWHIDTFGPRACLAVPLSNPRPRKRGAAGPVRAALMATAICLAAGCSDATQAPRQVAAKVNADEILVSQVNSAAAKTPAVAPLLAEQQRKQALDLLVEQQLAAQMALKQRLDRSPEVMRSLDSARREVLARTYVNQLVTRLPEPSDDQVQRYYDAHPLLFAQRRFYQLREIAMPARGAPLANLKTLAPIASMERLEAWLRLERIEYAVSASSRPAEQIAAPVLEAVAGLKEGQTAVVENAQGVFVVRLLGSRLAPLDQAAAAPGIRKALAAEEARAAVARDLALLREKARIEYRGEFVEPDLTATAGRKARPGRQQPATYLPVHGEH